jgi:hypothetical protein
VLHLVVRVPLLAAQFLAILSCASATGLVVFRKLQRDFELKKMVWAWPGLEDFWTLSPYIAYGFFYYLLLFGDRLTAWTAQTYSAAMPVQFRGDYETAVNLGLAVFVVLAGYVHCGTAEFYCEVVRWQMIRYVHDIEDFKSDMLSFYQRGLLCFGLLAAGISCAAYVGGRLAGAITPATLSMSLWSMVGFTLLVWGLWNVNMLFGLSGAASAVIATAAGCVADIALGYVLSRLGTYHYAVFGFVAGSSVFAFVSTRSIIRAFRDLDYRYFAASA